MCIFSIRSSQVNTKKNADIFSKVHLCEWMTNPLTASDTHIRKGPRCLLPLTPHRAALSLGTAAALVATLGTPASFAAPTKANGAERAKAHTTISSLSSAQQKAGFNRFVITYTDSALNAGGINWVSPAGTQVATWSDARYP